MNSNTLQTYYSGVLKRLKSEVDLLNKIIPHNVTKGSQNESTIKSVIENFIPKKFSIGSGIVIDSFGNASNQIDLLIYDAQLYPSLFSQSSTSMYPVETVLAVIEIKTWLNKEELLRTFDNTKSIRKLKHYADTLTINQPSPEFPMKIVKYPTRPPVSFLFAFHTDSQNPSTWKKRFIEDDRFDDIPELSILLDTASVFRFTDIAVLTKETFEAMYFQVRAKDLDDKSSPDQVVYTQEANKKILINDSVYNSSNYKEKEEFPIYMPERAFLSFLIALNNLVEMQPRHISFDATKYLDKSFGFGQLIT